MSVDRKVAASPMMHPWTVEELRAFLDQRAQAKDELLIIVGPPKSGRPRTIDLDPATLAALKARKAAMGNLSLTLARDDTYVLANLDGSAPVFPLFSGVS